jgi:hypothetical protein
MLPFEYRIEYIHDGATYLNSKYVHYLSKLYIYVYNPSFH